MAVLSLQVKENNYRGHGDSVDQLCWHPSNPDLFVTASGDKTIRIWDVRTTKCIATVNTKGEYLPSREGPRVPAGPQLHGTCLQRHQCFGYFLWVLEASLLSAVIFVLHSSVRSNSEPEGSSTRLSGPEELLKYDASC